MALLLASPACSTALNAVATYQHWLDTAPLLTKATTSSAIFAAGDALAQAVDNEDEGLSLTRVARFAGTGFGNGVAWTYWYDFADYLLEPVSEPALRTVAAMALEQCLWCPLLFSVYIIPLSACLNGASLSEVPSEISKRLGPLLIANAKVWTPANVLIYNAPLQYRVLAANAIDLIWAAICSETAAECGTDDGCLVSAPNVIMANDFCSVPLDIDEDGKAASSDDTST